MPVAYTITLMSGSPVGEPTYEDLHRLACRLVEPPGGPGHHEQRKPFHAVATADRAGGGRRVPAAAELAA